MLRRCAFAILLAAAAGLRADAPAVPLSAPAAVTAAAAAPLDASPAAGTVYEVLPESQARFIVKSRSFFMPETVHGRQGTVTGRLVLAEGVTPTVSGELDIAAASLKSGIGMRDSKVRSTLRAADHPLIVFRLDGVDPFRLADLDSAGGVTVTAHGSLDVAGAQVPLTFPVFARRGADGVLRVDGMAQTGFADLKLSVPGIPLFVKLNDAIQAGASVAAAKRP